MEKALTPAGAAAPTPDDGGIKGALLLLLLLLLLLEEEEEGALSAGLLLLDASEAAALGDNGVNPSFEATASSSAGSRAAIMTFAITSSESSAPLISISFLPPVPAIMGERMRTERSDEMAQELKCLRCS